MPKPPADVILSNGRIHTLRDAEPKRSLCWAQNKILAVGADDEMQPHRTWRTEVVDLKGATVVPGFTDCHAHLEGLGRMLDDMNLIGVSSVEAIAQKVGERAARAVPGEWISGRGWDDSNWPGRRAPVHAPLSALTQHNPVWLKRRDGHSGLANLRALELAGIRRETPDPDGGQIVRDASREATGVLTDNAMLLVERKMPAATISDYQRWFTLAQEQCLRLGLTGVHDAGITATALEALKVMVREEMLQIRVYGMFYSSDPEQTARFAQRQTPFVRLGRQGLLTLRAIKLYMDGSLGSHTAWMLKPYHDKAKGDDGQPYFGLNLLTPDRLIELAQEAVLRGYQVCTHAIGDRAVRETLNAYELILQELVEGDHRLRVEHSQLVDPDDIPRFGKLNIIASVQPSHAVADMKLVGDRFGPSGHPGAYPWRTLIDTGAKLALGSDFPFEKASPLWSFYCAITRQDASGKPRGGWLPQMRLSRAEALHGLTLGAAFASYQEEDLGAIAPGSLADLTILSNDILSVPEPEVLRTDVLATVVGGKFRHRSGV
ncbi:MAG TPA: amidohydrolase [Planctomycetota bacterium]|nr:amidohydrolase [Planctomycetota bacterium]